jgi:carbon-monoxide dehydrogenase large subunit
MAGELALRTEGRFLAVRARVVGNTGAYTTDRRDQHPDHRRHPLHHGVYTLPVCHVETRVAFTNTVPVVAYRGAGKPEFTYLIERLVDAAARETGRDRVALRRLNMVRAGQMPWTTPRAWCSIPVRFEKNLDDALVLSDRAGSRRAAARGRARQAAWLRSVGLPGTRRLLREPRRRGFRRRRHAHVATSATTNGQGHVTTFMQVVSQQLGLPERIRVVQGDSDRTGVGIGSVGSCETTVTGTAIVHCARVIIEKGRLIAGHLLEAPPADVEFEGRRSGGEFVIRRHRPARHAGRGRARRARAWPAAGIAPGLAAEDFYKPATYSFPSGCHVCEVDVDPETGSVELLSYAAVNDFGVVVNPLLLEGQVHGGVAQASARPDGVLTHDAQPAIALTGSFMDYCMPRADDLPMFGWARNEVPCKTNPLGVKGCGESGCTASLAAVMSAVIDALAPRGVTALDMPATPERVWRALHAAQRGDDQETALGAD